MGAEILSVSVWDAIRFLINDLVLAAIMFSFLERMYERKYDSNKVYIFSYVGMVILSTTIACFGNTIANGISSFLLICLWAIQFYKYNKIMCIFHCFCYMLMALFADVIATAVSSAVGSSTIEETLENQLSMYISAMLNWILLLLLCKVLITIFKKEKRNIINIKELVFFVCLTFLEVSITAYVLGFIEENSSGIILSLFLIGFFLLNIYI